MSELDEDTRRVWYQKGYRQAERDTTMAYELLKEALGVLESEYEGTDCHQELIEAIRTYLPPQYYSPEDRNQVEQINTKELWEQLLPEINKLFGVDYKEQRNNDKK